MILELSVIETHRGEISVEKMLKLYDVAWTEFLDGEEPTDALRLEFANDIAAEVGRELLDECVTYKGYETSVETEVRKP